ncbi:hypothetical protein IAI53_14185 [Thauera sp. CAU 1555]|uniref:Uncharacterized protein n=1 Tax=Thauera sedimentorum TaxID=2767595 RepID=A0ABR9BCY0_9RHOO|nr:hypothetical protein [Thauera sedimentorum]MBC9073122.1 hypothetical protein [Thauera sedimentorum]MBD8504041.1 hypothetical protein [Thauera sedimentorum]
MGALAVHDERAADGPQYTSRPELALSAVLYLMSRFPATRSSAVADAIADHLQILCNDPRQPACVRETADKLIGDWHTFGALCDEELLPQGGLAN